MHQENQLGPPPPLAESKGSLVGTIFDTLQDNIIKQLKTQEDNITTQLKTQEKNIIRQLNTQKQEERELAQSMFTYINKYKDLSNLQSSVMDEVMNAVLGQCKRENQEKIVAAAAATEKE